MTTYTLPVPERVRQAFKSIQKLPSKERLLLAHLLLDSLIESEDESDWQAMSLASFIKDWDNPEDAIYDNWREIYGITAR